MSAAGGGEKMAGEVETACRELVALTRRILRAADEEDLGSMGEAVAGRQQVLERLAGLKKANPTGFAACRPLLREAAGLNKEAGRAVSGLLARKKEELRRANRTFRPLLRYGDSRFGLAAGMVLDRMD